MSLSHDPWSALDTFETGKGVAGIYRISRLEDAGLCNIDALPFSIRVLLESVLRHCDGVLVCEEDVRHLAGWSPTAGSVEIPFLPTRVILQDFTGVPVVVDLAAMRSAMQRLGGDPDKINPLIPVDLVIDHSVQVDRFDSPDALEINVELEFSRNRERYEFLHWAQGAFNNFRAVPPGVGIVHQVNLEYLAGGVFLHPHEEGPIAVPDSLVGTDSHTTMINGLGVLGWGVGGIEAEAAMLGQPIYMLLPEVIGVELTGSLPPGATATDLVLTVTERLRREKVVGKFVEFFGDGMASMSLADRATIANMAPEYGATMGFFPIDSVTLSYLRLTGRDPAQVELVERYTQENHLFRHSDSNPEFTRRLQFDLGEVTPSLAGPKRPQDRVPLDAMKQSFAAALRAPVSERGFALDEVAIDKTAHIEANGDTTDITHGAVVIAAITSCTNTSNPSVMVAAGLLAKNAVARGLSVPSYVKTSLAPGSRVVTDYLNASGLTDALEKIGFYTVGYGCTTCIGNSGPLPEPVAAALQQGDLIASAVLSGNRNFEGRVNPLVKANYLASPPLVVAYALAGSTAVDLTSEPIGEGSDGVAVFLADIWPDQASIDAALQSVSPEMFRTQYADVFTSNPQWNAMEQGGGSLFVWNRESTYVQEPPFLLDLPPEPKPIMPITGACVLLLLGDSVTTDHISPAGAIAAESPAGRYLLEQGVAVRDFNSYGSRRGNDRVMTRGTFANIRIRNQLAPGTEGGVTRLLPEGEVMSVFDAAMEYRKRDVPLVVLAGAEYGTGSSRDWAAKGTYLLGVRAVIATSYERIHRSNLVGMGVLPLEFVDGSGWQSLGLSGEETFDLAGLDDSLQPGARIEVTATDQQGNAKSFEVRARIDTPVELEYYRNGGILQTVLRNLMARS